MGLSVGFWVGDGRRTFRDAAPFLCFGLFGALGQGRRPEGADCYAGLWPYIRSTWAGTLRASRSVPNFLGLPAPHKGGQ